MASSCLRLHTLTRGRTPKNTIYRFASTSAHSGNVDPSAYCRDLVRKHDYEGYLSTPFYSQQTQGGYLALKAFQIELATVHDTVSNPLIGKMRMQFWRDAVKSLSTDAPTRHPVVLALHQASQHARLSPYHFKRVIDARETEMGNMHHLSVESFTAHAESTSSTLLYLLLSLLRLNTSSSHSTLSLSEPHSHNPTSDPLDPDNLAHAASHLGVAQSIVTLLRAMPFHASKGRMVIPAEITAKHKVRQEDVFRRGGEAEGISDAVYDFACVAHGHLAAAREMFERNEGKVAKPALPVFMAGVPVTAFLERLEATNFNAFEPSLARRSWNLPWKMWKASFQNQF